uniref:NADH-ubiquinone oxidoreductase chain 4 n=1 Tax=Melanastera paucipunctata TaxID=2218046 RepID=A0A344A2A0_9HEMI|nr:NADH dehydrogenase subunit 4 [Diclidophlebia paucipunctata]AWU48891.1 NADH dehydrogenase subunit 4 [Diclidophlebia paucipunctata]
MLEMIISSFFIVGSSWSLLSNFLMCYSIVLILFMYDSTNYIIKLIMIILSFWLIMLMLLSVTKNDQSLELKLLILILLMILEMVFYFNSMILFYMCFEMSVIPMFLIVFGWGYQPDRMEAGVYMLCYTVIFSLPLLVGIFYFDYINMKNKFLIFLLFSMAFLVKFPMVGFHLWLPRAHVEAPVFGSMILAGIMLKLGGYGLVKISSLLTDIFLVYNWFIVVFSVMGGVILSLLCFVQVDMKLLIAYSSIVHMSAVLSNILILKESGLMGSIYMMVGHGFCSSGLFYIMGVSYSRTMSRSFFINKGFLTLVPVSSFWWFLFCCCNLSFPPSLNLPGEILLFSSLLSWEFSLIVLICILSFFSSLYSIYLFSFSLHGSMINYYSFSSFNIKESLICFLHWIPLNLIIFDLSLFWC